MTEHQHDNSDFEGIAGKVFNPLEQQMGPEAFEVHLDLGRANVESVKAHTEAEKMHAQVHARRTVMMALGGLTLIVWGSLVLAPVVVFLWRWAVS